MARAIGAPAQYLTLGCQGLIGHEGHGPVVEVGIVDDAEEEVGRVEPIRVLYAEVGERNTA